MMSDLQRRRDAVDASFIGQGEDCRLASKGKGAMEHPVMPDGRYRVIQGRLWRTPNPSLCQSRRQTWLSS